MIRHIILWRYTEAGRAYGEDALIDELNRQFKSLIGQIDGLLAIDIRHCDAKGDPGYHDVMLEARFADKEALVRYMQDAGHARIREWDQQFVHDRAGFDYEAG